MNLSLRIVNAASEVFEYSDATYSDASIVDMKYLHLENSLIYFNGN